MLELRFDDAARSVTSATLFTTNTGSFGTNPKIYGSNDGMTWSELLDTQASCNGGLSVKYLAGSPYPNNIYGGYPYTAVVEVSSWAGVRASLDQGNPLLFFANSISLLIANEQGVCIALGLTAPRLVPMAM